MKLKRQHIDSHVIATVRIALMMVIVFAATIVGHYYSSIQNFRDNMVETIIQEAKTHISHSLDELDNTHANVAKLLADIYSFKIEHGYTVDEMLQDFEDKKRILNVKNVGLADLKNNVYLDSFGQVLTLDLQSPRDLWIQEFLDIPQDDQFYFYDPDEAEYEPLYSFFYNQKVRGSDGQVIGITGIGIDYQSLYAKFQGLNNSVDVFFLNNKGQIRLPKTVKNETIISLFPYLSSEELDLATDLSEHDWRKQVVWGSSNDEQSLFYFHHIEEIETTIMVKFDVTEFYQKSRLQHVYSLLIGVVATVLLVGLHILASFYQGRKLKRSAFRDPLTKCHNRNYLDKHVKASPYWSHVKSSGYSMMMFDIDHFKGVNDSKGHLEGDQVLAKVAAIVKNCLRDEDEFARIGGDEFLVLLDKNSRMSLNVAERIRKCVDQKTSVSISVGLTDIYEDDDFDSALARADTLLYEAKDSGRNQVKIDVDG